MSSIVNANEFGEFSLQHFQYFLAVYEERSFIKAARGLTCLSPPSARQSCVLSKGWVKNSLSEIRMHAKREVATAIKPYVEAALTGRAKVQEVAARFAAAEAAQINSEAAEKG